MLILITTITLFLLPFLIIVLRKVGIRTAYLWLILTAVSAILFLAFLIIPFQRINPIEINNWFFSKNQTIEIVLHADKANYGLAIAFLGFNLIFFLTNIVRLEVKQAPRFWFFQLFSTSLLIIASFAFNLWTLILLWAANDILEIIFVFIFNQQFESEKKRFLNKLIGILLLFFSAGMISDSNNNLPANFSSQFSFILVLIATALHSGVFPIKPLDKSIEDQNQTIAATLLKFSGFAISLKALTLFNQIQISIIPSLILFISGLFLFIKIPGYISIKKGWLVQVQSLLTVSLGYVFFLIIGKFQGSINNFLIVLFFLIQFENLLAYSDLKYKNINIASVLLYLGLPFTLTTFGERLLIGESLGVKIFPVFLIHFGLLIAYLTHLDSKNIYLKNSEPWYRISISLAYLVFFTTAIAVVVKQMVIIQNEVRYLWIGALFILLCLIFYLFRKSIKLEMRLAPNNISENINQVRSAKFKSIVIWPIGFTGNLINRINEIFEGQSGLLWSLVLLLLLLTIF